MPEIIDTLTAYPNKSPFFTASGSAEYASLQEPANPSPFLVNASGQNKFQQGDNFILLSAGIFIPYSFSPYVLTSDTAVATRLKLTLVDDSGNVYSLPELGPESKIHIPIENYETGMGIFIPVLTKTSLTGVLLAGGFYIKYLIEGLVISLIGAPSNFTGKNIPVFPYIKVLHNLPLTTGEPGPGTLVADFTWELIPVEG